MRFCAGKAKDEAFYISRSVYYRVYDIPQRVPLVEGHCGTPFNKDKQSLVLSLVITCHTTTAYYEGFASSVPAKPIPG